MTAITNESIEGVLRAAAAATGEIFRIERPWLVEAMIELVERRTMRGTQPLPVVTLDEPAVRHEDHCEACDWLDAVLEVAGEASAEIPPAPIDALADFVRAGGELGEIPALALMDELVAARSMIAALEGRIANALA
jgi:hypothetical protein